jgi:hypothetical protein
MILNGKRESSKPTWSSVKAAISGMEKKQLIALVSDLYRLSKDNQAFLHARFGVGDDTLDPYKKTIEACMYPDVYRNKPVRISRAKQAIAAYAKAVGDPRGEAELMTFFVERGNSFTLDFGDIDGAFYDALNLMYSRAIDKVLSLPEEERYEFQSRLKAIMTSSSSIGWGYHDRLCDDYYEGFPEDQ